PGSGRERKIGQKRTELRTHFTFRIGTWTSDGESIVEHLARRAHHRGRARADHRGGAAGASGHKVLADMEGFMGRRPVEFPVWGWQPDGHHSLIWQVLGGVEEAEQSSLN